LGAALLLSLHRLPLTVKSVTLLAGLVQRLLKLPRDFDGHHVFVAWAIRTDSSVTLPSGA
jgi:hypothetical protein